MSAPTAGETQLCDTLTTGRRVIITIAVMVATLLEVLDTSIVNVALPNMQAELGATLDQIGWVATGYIISNVIVLPLTGWLSDHFGRRKYLGYSVILFTASSFGCGISRSLDMLVLFRVLQGAGGAAFLATAQATLIEINPPRLQGFAQAMFGVGVVMAPTLGPSLGGYLTDRWSWPFIFFINVPIGIVAAILTFMHVPDSPHANAPSRADFLGIALLAIGLGSLQTVLERGQRDDWFDSNFITVMAFIAALGLILFVWWELHPGNASPAVSLRILNNRNLTAGCVCALGLGFTLYGTIFALPQFLQNVQPHSAEQTGILLIPGGLASAFVLPIVGQLVNRFDVRLLLAAGMLLTVVSLFMFAGRFEVGTPDSALFWPLICRGAGLGLQFVPLSLASLGTLPQREVGNGAGLYNLSRQLGGSFGIAILATVLDRREHFHYARLAAEIRPTSVLVQHHLTTLQSAAALHGLLGEGGRRAAMLMLHGTVFREATIGGYIDLFRLGAYAGIAALLMLALFKKPRISRAALH